MDINTIKDILEHVEDEQLTDLSGYLKVNWERWEFVNPGELFTKKTQEEQANQTDNTLEPGDEQRGIELQ